MLKKIAFIALVVAALLCGTWGYFYLQDLKKPTLRAFDVLPDSCSLVIEIKDPANFRVQLTESNVMWEEFVKIGEVRKFGKIISLLDSMTVSGVAREYLGNDPVYAAAYGSENNSRVVYAFNLSDINESEKALEFFEKNFGAKKLSSGFYQCAIASEGNHEFYIYSASGLVMACADKSFLEQLTARNSKTSLAANSLFMAAYKTAARDKGVGLFLHTPLFGKNLRSAFLSSGPLMKDETEKWIPADLSIEPSDLNLQGFLPVDTAGRMSALYEQDADDLQALYEKLPYNTFCLEAVRISDYGKFCTGSYHGNVQERKAQLKKYSDSISADAQTEMARFVGDYLAVFSAATEDTVFEYGLAQVSEEEKAHSFLKAVADSVHIDSDSANLFSITDKKLFGHLCAGFFTGEFKYVSLVNEQAVFCNSVRGLAEYRRAVSEKNNFSANERTASFLSKNFNADLNYLFYCDVFRNRDLLKKTLSASLNKKLETSQDLFEKFDAVGFSLQKLKEKMFYKAHTGFNPKNKMYQNTLWEALLDTAVHLPPVPLINHKTGEKELVCQDLNANLYLLSNTGKILWKKNVAETILGQPAQVDFFANGKLQMLFVTQNYIHLVDRNGNYVAGFPVRIKSGAAAGLTVFDYDNSKKYRLWLPLKNNTVVCLGTDCKSVEGFVPVVLKAPLARPVAHLLLQQKDYFVLTDTLGNVYITNRKGEQRAPVTGRVPAGSGPLYFDVGKDVSKTTICFADIATKSLKKLSLTDKMETLPLQTKTAPRGYFYDTLGGNQPAWGVYDDAQLEVFDFFAKKINTLELKSLNFGDCEALYFGDKKVYASIEKNNGTLMLWDAKTLQPIENEIKLSALPASYNLLKGQGNYLVGVSKNKIFCIRP